VRSGSFVHERHHELLAAATERNEDAMGRPSSARKRITMQVQVERCADHLEMPVRIRFDGREVEIVENVDQWYGPDYCYFKIKGNDGNLYILRFDEGRAEWQLMMFQSQADSTHLHP
jgi:hypothetical protein